MHAGVTRVADGEKEEPSYATLKFLRPSALESRKWSRDFKHRVMCLSSVLERLRRQRYGGWLGEALE